VTGAQVALALMTGAVTDERCRKTVRLLDTRTEYEAMLRALPPAVADQVRQACAPLVQQKFGV
jgi:hypothetical protein